MPQPTRVISEHADMKHTWLESQSDIHFCSVTETLMEGVEAWVIPLFALPYTV